MIDLNKEMAWVTFLHDGWETKWHPVLDLLKNLEFDDENIKLYCRIIFNNDDNWVSFGIAPTSQMVIRNSVRDNL